MKLEQLKLSSREKMLHKSKREIISPSGTVLKDSSKDISPLKLISLEGFSPKIKILNPRLKKISQMKNSNSKEEIDLLPGKTIEGLTTDPRKDSTTLTEETTEIEIQTETSTTDLGTENSTKIVISIETKTVISTETKIVITTNPDLTTRIVISTETKIVISTETKIVISTETKIVISISPDSTRIVTTTEIDQTSKMKDHKEKENTKKKQIKEIKENREDIKIPW